MRTIETLSPYFPGIESNPKAVNGAIDQPILCLLVAWSRFLDAIREAFDFFRESRAEKNPPPNELFIFQLIIRGLSLSSLDPFLKRAWIKAKVVERGTIGESYQVIRSG